MAEVYAASEEEIRQFISLTSCDYEQSKFLLESSAGNLDLALSMFADLQRPPSLRHQASPAAGARTFTASRQVTGQGSNSLGQALAMALCIPTRLISLLTHIVSSILSSVLSFVDHTASAVLPASLGREVKALIQGKELDASEQARFFVQNFKASYGDRHPNFLEVGIRQATSTAKEECCFLLTYLHSPEHQDTDTFCKDVLCSPAIVDYVNAHFVCWGGDIRFTDPYVLSSRLSVCTYPHVALLLVSPDNKVRLLASIAGSLEADKMLAIMMHAVDEQGALLVAQRAEIQERDYTRRLLAEQNDEYEASLAADREREKQQAEERKRVEEERDLQEAVAAKAREEAEAEARRVAEAAESEARKAAELEAAMAKRREEKRAALPEEPGADVPSSSVALLRVRLPDGTSCQRRFLGTHTMGHVFDFVCSLDSTNYPTFNLVCNFPRKVFSMSSVDMGLTLQAAELTPHGNLFVQPVEDD